MEMFMVLNLRAIYLWRPQKMSNFVSLPPLIVHPQKWTIDLYFFFFEKFLKHMTNFKTPSNSLLSGRHKYIAPSHDGRRERI